MSIRKGTTIIAGNSSPLDWTGTLQEYNIALENGTIKENMICYITDDTLYTDDIRPEIETLNSVKANKDLSNLSEVGEKHFLNKSQITNCITEIPQNIKLELNNGVLTLKAGSIVTVPNGFEADGKTPKFDYVSIESDLTLTATQTNTYQEFLFINPHNQFEAVPSSYCTSGGTKPTTFFGSHAVWYDTTNNRLKLTSNSGSSWVEGLCLPIALFTITTTAITSINQVFNGFGYIGSTIWVDKGVKGLIPNGRNEDGTLNNIEFTTEKVTTISVSDPIKYFGIKLEGGLKAGVYGDWLYNESTNTVQIGNDIYTWMYGGTLTCTNGVISNFQPKLPFKVIDKYEASGLSMPSSKYIDLTLGASGTIYTAPANGWVSVNKTATASNQNLDIGSSGVGFDIHSSSNGQWLCVSTPVRKGTTFYVNYTAGGAVNWFRFRYAEGEV